MNVPILPPEKIAAVAQIPLATRLAHEIPKPRDWQAFQRNCVLLFRDELDDPHAQEYGRGGQNQRGVDILARRNGNPDCLVGIQCRRIERPLRYDKMIKDCREALKLSSGLREIIFATTAPDDTHAEDAARRAESELRAKGHDVRVVVYGWGQLQTLIARHDVAYSVFCPWILATSVPQPTTLAGLSEHDSGSIAAQLAPLLTAELRRLQPTPSLTTPIHETASSDATAEDPALHGRIDVFRDLFKHDYQPALAEKGLLGLLEAGGLDHKPWAQFRIQTNLGSIAFHMGREAEVVFRYEAAYNLRPSDTNAKANLALVRTIQGRFQEAMSLAQDALSGTPRADHAVGYLLQAAARSGWQGEPESLVPRDLIGTMHADLGLAEFYRRREVPGWQARCIEFAHHHPTTPEFKPINAVAVLSLAVESGATVSGGLGPVTAEDLTLAADDMKGWVERMLDAGFGDDHDRHAHLNNACVLLRLCGRYQEIETLLHRARSIVTDDPVLRRLLAIALTALGRRKDAIETLAGELDPENCLFRAELSGSDDPAGALEQALAVGSVDLSSHLGSLRWHLIAELSLRTGRLDTLRLAVAGLRNLDPGDPVAALFELRGEQRAGLPEEEFCDKLAELAQGVPETTSISTRHFLAAEFQDAHCPEDAVALLEGRVDLSRSTPTAILFLQALAEARRDDEFHAALNAATKELREDPAVLWTAAAHAWNIGDLDGAYRAASSLIERNPKNARVRLFRLEVMLRQNRSADLLSDLDQPLEYLPKARLEDSFRIASLLGHFGFAERAAAFTYKLFLGNRENPRAWMTFANVVLDRGEGGVDRSGLWSAAAVVPDVAVDLAFDNGTKMFFVVEPNRDLRKVDDEAWEPDHPFVQLLAGMSKGERFVDVSGRKGTIADLRHKFVARLHYIMANYETRFPDQQGFHSIPIAPGEPGGLDEMTAVLKTRHDWVKQEQEQYVAGPWPLGLLALRLGLDTIEVAEGIASKGVRLKVAVGSAPEREAALQAVRENACKGCVLDLLSFWTAWRLRVLDVVVATCGAIHVSQGVMDRLRARREKLRESVREGAKSASYVEGKISLLEIPSDVIRQWLEDLDSAIKWLETTASVCPLIAGSSLPKGLRKHLSLGQSDIYDSLAIAMQSGLLLVTDDLPTRELGVAFGFKDSCWMHIVLMAAMVEGHIDQNKYVRLTANLIDAGHNYIGVSGSDLARALLDDSRAGEVPGYLLKALSKAIGGKIADPVSHACAVIEFLFLVWRNPDVWQHREAGTSHLLRQLLRERHEDYVTLLAAVIWGVRSHENIVRFLTYWTRGHFIPKEKVQEELLRISRNKGS